MILGFHRALRDLKIWHLVVTALAFWFPASAQAQFHALPYASSIYEYNSNLFALPANALTPIGSGHSSLADHDIVESAGIQALYDRGPEQLYFNTEFRHFGFDQYSELNHNEFLVHGGLKWTVLDLLDGVVDYKHERSMVPFVDFTSTDLFLQSQSVTTASANIMLTPDWRLQSEGVVNDLDSPRPGFSHLSLTEDTIQEGLRYLGVARVSAGFDAIYVHGHFNGDEFVIAPRYNQTAIQATAKYVATGLSSFNGSIGYTRRREENAGTVGETTGLLSYKRLISDLTAVDVELSRAVNSYVTYGSTEIDTGAAIEATWNATGKITIAPRYQWTYSTFPNVDLTGTSAPGGERRDHYQLATLSVKYQVLNWLLLSPFAQYETRRSDVGLYSFNRTIYGLEVEVRLSGQADQPYQLSLPDIL